MSADGPRDAATSTVAAPSRRVVRASAEARRQVSEGADVVRDGSRAYADDFRDTVSTKPFMSVGIAAAVAFGAGLVLGLAAANG